MALNKGKYSYNESQIFLILQNYGYNTAAICAVLANIEAESGFKHDVDVNDLGKMSYGLCQWRAGRRTRLLNMYGSSPTVKQQVEYLVFELKNESSYKLTRSALESTPDTTQGAYNTAITFVQNFERPQRYQNGRDVYIERANRAVEYFNYYRNGYQGDISVAGDLSINDSGSGTSGSSSGTSNVPAYVALSTIDPYSEVIVENLERVRAGGFDYGYLIDLTYGGEFKFYIPEFNESAGANWTDVDIPGRSVTIKSYTSTNSRVISIALDLYASEGLYKTEDPVGDLHKDLNFVKSLEYPDYNNAITTPPANVHLILGSAVNIQGIVSNVSVEHLKPLDSQNRAMYAKLSFTVTQIAANPPGVYDIREGVSAIISTESPETLTKSSDNKLTGGLRSYE